MRVLLFLLLMVGSAAAQQPAPPSQTLLQIETVMAGWVLQLESLQLQNALLQARIKALEDKYEPKPPADKP